MAVLWPTRAQELAGVRTQPCAERFFGAGRPRCISIQASTVCLAATARTSLCVLLVWPLQHDEKERWRNRYISVFPLARQQQPLNQKAPALISALPPPKLDLRVVEGRALCVLVLRARMCLFGGGMLWGGTAALCTF